MKITRAIDIDATERKKESNVTDNVVYMSDYTLAALIMTS